MYLTPAARVAIIIRVAEVIHGFITDRHGAQLWRAYVIATPVRATSRDGRSRSLRLGQIATISVRAFLHDTLAPSGHQPRHACVFHQVLSLPKLM